MRRIALITGFIALVGTSSYATYSGYTYQRQITIPSANVFNASGTLTNFPVLISTVSVTYSTAAAGGRFSNSNGFDSIFSTKTDCSVSLSHDTETYNNTGSTYTTVWVKVPVLDTATLNAATFYWCYGNSAITTYQGVSTNTWDSSYMGVYHMADNTTLSLKDSTSNGITATTTSVVLGSGAVGSGAYFNGTTSTMTAGTAANFNLSTVGTVSLWFYSTLDADQWQNMISKGNSATGRNGFAFNLYTLSNKKVYYFMADATAYQDSWETNAYAPANAWHHAVLVWGTAVKIYIDGVRDLGIARTKTPVSNVYKMTIGAGAEALSYQYKGMIDEVEISNVERTGDWIKTSYNNQKLPGTFITIGSETTDAGASSSNAPFFGTEF